MRVRLVLCVLVAAVAFAQETSGPFGLHRGMTPEQVIQIVGKKAIKETEGDIVRFTAVPKSHPAFESYSLIFSPKDGLLKIVAYGKDIRTNGFGEAVQEAMAEIRDAVARTYGQPDDNFDFVRSGSLWSEPGDWMMGLLKEERTLSAYWKKSLPNQIHIVGLEARALSLEKAYLVLSYEFEGWSNYVAELKKKEGTVF